MHAHYLGIKSTFWDVLESVNKTTWEKCQVWHRSRKRERPIGMADMGVIQAHIARTFGCTPLTVSRLLQRYNTTGRIQGMPKIGRPRVTTGREDRNIRNLLLRTRFQTATLTAATDLGRRISKWTVLRRLSAASKCRFLFVSYWSKSNKSDPSPVWRCINSNHFTQFITKVALLTGLWLIDNQKKPLLNMCIIFVSIAI